MDLHSINRLASREYAQKASSATLIPDDGSPNVEVQPGWAQRPLLAFANVLVSLIGHPNDTHEPSAASAVRRIER